MNFREECESLRATLAVTTERARVEKARVEKARAEKAETEVVTLHGALARNDDVHARALTSVRHRAEHAEASKCEGSVLSTTIITIIAPDCRVAVAPRTSTPGCSRSIAAMALEEGLDAITVW